MKVKISEETVVFKLSEAEMERLLADQLSGNSGQYWAKPFLHSD
jgi:hypothetical protein